MATDELYNVELQQSRLEHSSDLHRQEHPTLPPLSAIETASKTLPKADSTLYLAGQPGEDVVRHIIHDIVPALNGQGRSSRYYGFVTGGVLPIAEWADNVVSHMDQNCGVHLPTQTISTAVEDAALEMIVGLLRLGDGQWKGKTFTTGATASNILGLVCGREAVLNRRLGDKGTVGELGLLQACIKAGVSDIQVLTSTGHSSLSKAASIVGLGRGSVVELGLSADEPWRLDFAAVEEHLKKPNTASIISVSAGEVNTGRFALEEAGEMRKLRELADKYGAWIHLDGAFGIFARALEDTEEFATLHKRGSGVELADSITVDGHKMLNVPYDCGMFFTRSTTTLQSAFLNPNAAYLSSGPAKDTIPSPLNIGLENSRRFRALPAYAALLNEGRPGYARLFASMARLSRRVAAFLRDSPHYELLPDAGAPLEEVFMVVIFRAKDPKLNGVLAQKINETRQMYVSGTSWKGEPAVRIAVSNWKVNVEKDYAIVVAILDCVAAGKEFDMKKIEQP